MKQRKLDRATLRYLSKGKKPVTIRDTRALLLAAKAERELKKQPQQVAFEDQAEGDDA